MAADDDGVDELLETLLMLAKAGERNARHSKQLVREIQRRRARSTSEPTEAESDDQRARERVAS